MISKANPLLLAVSEWELFCLHFLWVSWTSERAAISTSAVSDVHTLFFFFHFSKQRIQLKTSAKKGLLILPSLSVTRLCSFTRRDLPSPVCLPSLGAPEEGSVGGDVQETAEGDVMGGRATVQCFRSWVRSVDERQRVRKRKRGRKKGWEDRGKMVCGCQATIDNQIPKHQACGALPSLQAWKSLSFLLHSSSHTGFMFSR